MSQFNPAGWLVAFTACASLSVAAQTNVAAQAAPAPAQIQTAPQAFRSAMEGYQPFGDEKQLSWKDANDTVGKIGGWRAYAKEAAQPANTPANTPDKPTGATGAASAHPHAGHGKP